MGTYNWLRPNEVWRLLNMAWFYVSIYAKMECFPQNQKAFSWNKWFFLTIRINVNKATNEDSLQSHHWILTKNVNWCKLYWLHSFPVILSLLFINHIFPFFYLPPCAIAFQDEKNKKNLWNYCSTIISNSKITTSFDNLC